MEKNGSPEPIFETDESCTYFLSVLPANVHFLKKEQATAQAEEKNDFINKSVQVVHGEMKANEILHLLNLKHMKHFRTVYLVPSIEAGYIEMTIPDKPSSPNQTYRLTEKGKLLKAQLEQEREVDPNKL